MTQRQRVSAAPREGAREEWSSRAGFVLASIGSAVGIGNLWRFPYVVGTSGGGAFLFPYVIAVGLCGLPLMILEFSLGRRFRSSVVPVFAAMHRGLRWLGFSLVFVQTMILSYYLVVTGWVLAYFLAFTAGAPVTFAEFTGSYVPLLFAALTSAVSILELPVATLIDVWGISRRWAVVAATAVVLLLGLPSALSYTALRLELFGTPLLDLKDFAFGTVGMTLGALALSVAAGWFVDESIVRGAVGGRPWMVRLFLGALRFFIPAVLALTLAVRMLSGV